MRAVQATYVPFAVLYLLGIWATWGSGSVLAASGDRLSGLGQWLCFGWIPAAACGLLGLAWGARRKDLAPWNARGVRAFALMFIITLPGAVWLVESGVHALHRDRVACNGRLQCSIERRREAVPAEVLVARAAEDPKPEPASDESPPVPGSTTQELREPRSVPRHSRPSESDSAGAGNPMFASAPEPSGADDRDASPLGTPMGSSAAGSPPSPANGSSGATGSPAPAASGSAHSQGKVGGGAPTGTPAGGPIGTSAGTPTSMATSVAQGIAPGPRLAAGNGAGAPAGPATRAPADAIEEAIPVASAAQPGSAATSAAAAADSPAPAVEHFDNGSKRRRGSTVLDAESGTWQKDGAWTEWARNGQKISEGRYARGKKTGLWREWHSNGNKKCEETFVAGQSQGPMERWHANGQLALHRDELSTADGHVLWIEEAYFKNGAQQSRHQLRDGVRQGPSQAWHPNRKSRETGAFARGSKDGVWLYWNERGEELGREIWVDGRLRGKPVQAPAHPAPAVSD
jgi:hypothetical protein